MQIKIVRGTVTVDGQLYKAFENGANRQWYIVKGDKANGEIVQRGIQAKSGKEALTKWLETRP